MLSKMRYMVRPNSSHFDVGLLLNSDIPTQDRYGDNNWIVVKSFSRDHYGALQSIELTNSLNDNLDTISKVVRDTEEIPEIDIPEYPRITTTSNGSTLLAISYGPWEANDYSGTYGICVSRTCTGGILSRQILLPNLDTMEDAIKISDTLNTYRFNF